MLVVFRKEDCLVELPDGKRASIDQLMNSAQASAAQSAWCITAHVANLLATRAGIKNPKRPITQSELAEALGFVSNNGKPDQPRVSRFSSAYSIICARNAQSSIVKGIVGPTPVDNSKPIGKLTDEIVAILMAAFWKQNVDTAVARMDKALAKKTGAQSAKRKERTIEQVTAQWAKTVRNKCPDRSDATLSAMRKLAYDALAVAFAESGAADADGAEIESTDDEAIAASVVQTAIAPKKRKSAKRVA